MCEAVAVRPMDDSSPMIPGQLDPKIPICVIHGSEDVAYSDAYMDRYLKVICCERRKHKFEYHKMNGASHFMVVSDAVK